MVLEGGSIDVNGAGLLLTTEECLLSDVQARNPGMTRREIERTLRDYLGVAIASSGCATASPATTRTATSTIWRASSTPDTVVVASEDDRSDANYATAAGKLRAAASRRACAW